MLCHINLLIEAGLINGNMTKVMSGFKDCRINGLTWYGYEFLDAARDESIWNKAKDKLLKPAVALTFEMLKDWLKDQAQAALKGL